MSSMIPISYDGVKALPTRHPDIQKLKRKGYEASIHGTKVWNSSFVLIDFLKKEKCIEKGSTVFDVGCGWGLSGIYLAKKYKTNTISIDADPAMEVFLSLHAKLNQVDVTFEKKKFQQIKCKDLKGCHTLIGSDICFWDELVKPLYNLIRRSKKAGVKQIFLADPGRSTFWELAELCETKFDGYVIGHKTKKPKPSEKQILCLDFN